MWFKKVSSRHLLHASLRCAIRGGPWIGAWCPIYSNKRVGVTNGYRLLCIGDSSKCRVMCDFWNNFVQARPRTYWPWDAYILQQLTWTFGIELTTSNICWCVVRSSSNLGRSYEFFQFECKTQFFRFLWWSCLNESQAKCRLYKMSFFLYASLQTIFHSSIIEWNGLMFSTYVFCGHGTRWRVSGKLNYAKFRSRHIVVSLLMSE